MERVKFSIQFTPGAIAGWAQLGANYKRIKKYIDMPT
jgi:hypothetical protein